jgi:predicted RNA-binding Zn-ribbon protein involved in translation (DUF1610 family)
VSVCAIETCNRPVPDTSFICPPCGAKLRAALERVPDDVTPPALVDGGRRRAIDGGRTVYGIASSLVHAIQRETRVARDTDDPTPYAIREMPLPYDPAASEILNVLADTMTFWAISIADQRGIDYPAANPEALSWFLAGQVDWLRAQAAGAEAFDELTAAIRAAERATDRPAERRYAGPCTARIPTDEPNPTGIPHAIAPDLWQECGTDLYAREGRDQVVCPTCGTEYPLAARREWLRELAAERLLPAAELCRAIDGLGRPVSLNTFKSWVKRDQLVPRGHIPGYLGREVAIYRVGDVIALVEAAAARREVMAG